MGETKQIINPNGKERKMKTPTKGNNVYEMITNQIVENLEKGFVPWQKPWSTHSPYPVNLTSKRNYRGINVFILYLQNLANNFNSPYWMTFNQAKKVSGYKKAGRFWKWDKEGEDPKFGVKKGETGTRVVFWKFLDIDDPDAPSGKKKIPLLRYYTVFNVDQCNLPEKVLAKIAISKRTESEIGTIDVAEEICNNYKVDFDHGGDRAYYHKKDDKIQMPEKARFSSDEEYYMTRFHEMVHSTGSKERLDRDSIVDASYFGDENYSKEELIAEMGACFLAAESGINLENTTLFENSTSYLTNWMKKIKDDPKLLIQAAGKAQKAVDFILGKEWNNS